MISFIDEKGKRHGALAEIKRKKAVNGEKSIEGIIYNNKNVIDNIDIGWKILFEGEKYVITYALPVDNGNTVEIQFDAVHEFFYDFLKSSIYETLNGSNTMRAYLDFIFKDSGYSYLLDNQVPAIEKENFGMASRISLFNNIIKSTGAEFLVNGRVVRIMYKVGRDLSTVVRKGLNLQELKIEKNIKDFITYRKGFGAFIDPEDESLGRLEVEYESPLATIYGRLEGEPLVDERYSVEQNLYDTLEKSVENSYDISVHLTMEDLTKAGYEYEQPQEGDYIMVINEDIGFKRKVRIISYESEFDSTGELIDHQVTCNSVGLVQSTSNNKFDNIYKEIEKIEKSIDFVYIAANGKNMIYKGPTEPTGEDLVVNDMWYKPVGNAEYEMKIWTGAYWEKIVVEDARFNNLDASNITTGSIRGPNFELDLINDFILMGKSYPDDYKLYFDKNTFSMKLSNGKTIEQGITDAESSAKGYADSKVNDIEVGGRNLLLGTKDFNKGGIGDFVEPIDGFNVLHVDNTSGTSDIDGFLYSVEYEKNTEYILSFWLKGTGQVRFLASLYDYPIETVTSEGTVGIPPGGITTFDTPGEWKRVWVKIKTLDWTEDKFVKPTRIRAMVGSELYMYGFKLEKGNIATDWTPAPEDVEAEITSVKSRTSSLETDVTGITGRVSSAESNISTINGEITDHESRLDSAELKITPEAITSTVESNTTTLAKSSNIGSLIEQNSDSVKIAVGTVDKLKSNGMEIREDLVNIHTNEFSLDLLDANGNVITNITAENQGFKELFAENLRSPSVVQRHVGNKTFYVDAVNGSDDNEGTASYPLATVEGVFAGKLNNAKHLTGDVEIEIVSNYHDFIALDGFMGKGDLIIDFNNNDFTNTLSMYANSKKVLIRNCVQRNSSYYSCNISNCSYVELKNCKFYSEGASFNIYATEGSNVKVLDCDMYDASQSAIRADDGSTIIVDTCKGKADRFGLFAGHGSFISVIGTAPGGDESNSTEYYGQIINTNYTVDTGTSSPAPPTNPEIIKSWTSNNANHYKLKYSSWDTDGTVLQGDYGYGNNKGCWFFPNFWTTLSGKTIISAKLKITRKNNSGYSSAVPVYLHHHGYTSQPAGNPSLTSIGNIGSLKWGETKTFNLSSSLFSSLTNGTIKGFGVYTSSTSNSRYNRLDGKAVLTVTYK